MDNLYEKENITFEKADSLIKSNMPSFTSRFFRYFKENRPATSYYSYALSLAKFFEYLKSIGYDDDSCNIRTRFLNYPDTQSSIIRTSVLETYGQPFL